MLFHRNQEFQGAVSDDMKLLGHLGEQATESIKKMLKTGAGGRAVPQAEEAL